MREIRASDAKTHLLSLLDDVEQGETLVITRHGKPVARVIPEANTRQRQANDAASRLLARRAMMPAVTAADLKSLVEEGRRY
jgi:prevent-host-death family protein